MTFLESSTWTWHFKKKLYFGPTQGDFLDWSYEKYRVRENADICVFGTGHHKDLFGYVLNWSSLKIAKC